MPTVDLHALLSFAVLCQSTKLALLKVEPFVGVMQETSFYLASVSDRCIAQKLGENKIPLFCVRFLVSRRTREETLSTQASSTVTKK